MDKQELKRILHEQFVPMQEATQKKLAYLQSDEVFTDIPVIPEIDTGNSGDDSLMNAFNSSQPMRNVPVYNPSHTDGYKEIQASANPQYVSGSPTEQSIVTNKQNIAARIAALRGISMPGDYLQRKG